MAQPTKTTRDDWVQAGYDAVGRGGLDAIVVEDLAASLGVSKIGFYRRFADRDELVDAVIGYWVTSAEDLLEQHLSISDPVRQIRSFAEAALSDDRLRRADYWLLLHDRVHPTLTAFRVRARQLTIDWATGLLRKLGFDEPQAAARGEMLWSFYLGTVADLESRWDEVTPQELQRVLDALVAVVTSPFSPDRND